MDPPPPLKRLIFYGHWVLSCRKGGDNYFQVPIHASLARPFPAPGNFREYYVRNSPSKSSSQGDVLHCFSAISPHDHDPKSVLPSAGRCQTVCSFPTTEPPDPSTYYYYYYVLLLLLLLLPATKLLLLLLLPSTNYYYFY